jgi:hypothetical protein
MSEAYHSLAKVDLLSQLSESALKSLEQRCRWQRFKSQERECQKFCVRGVISSLRDEALSKHDGELRLRLEPFARRPFPIGRGVIENQV